MINERGRVIATSPGSIAVDVDRRTACSKCNAKTACGTAALDKLFRSRRNTIDIPTTKNFSVGETVIVSIPERKLVQASVMLYGLPLLLMILGAALMQAVSGYDLAAAIGGAVGLAGGFAVCALLVRLSIFGMLVPPKVRRIEIISGDQQPE